MFLSMNWIQDFVDLSGLDKIELTHVFYSPFRQLILFNYSIVYT